MTASPDGRPHDEDDLAADIGGTLQELRISLALLRGIPTHTNATTGTSTVTIDAGKGPAWIAAACAAAMLVGLVLGGGFVGVLLLEQSRRIGAVERDTRDLNDYLSAIYVAAPQLKPKEKTQ